jgi:type IV pilus assembly protein PilC
VGLNASGHPVNGHIHALSANVARVLLRQQGFFVHKIRKKRHFLLLSNQTIKPQDITRFCRQLATLLGAQIPLVQALDTLKTGQTNQALQALLDTIKQDIQAGLSLADALKNHPRCFNSLACHLVHAGEQSGSLAILLMKFTRYQEQIAKIHKKIKSACTYPFAISILAVLVTIGLLWFVVPQFESLFTSFHAELPAFTQGIIQLSRGIQTYGAPGIGLFVFCSGLLIYVYKHTTSMAFIIDKHLLRLPWIGAVLEQAVMARVTHTLSMMLSAGLPLMDALTSASAVAGNRAFSHALLTTREYVTQGVSLHKAMEQSQQFPNTVIQMIAVGEESGKLEALLAHAATQCSDALDEATTTLGDLLEPLLMTVLGMVVGTLIIAMYLPIFQLGAIV